MNALPHRDQDRVLTLYAHYFLAAALMRDNYIKLRGKEKSKGNLNQNDSVDKTIYIFTWLGFLGVTCEGFRKLSIRMLLQNDRPKEFNELIPISNKIGAIIKQHADPLREVRNNAFHLREDVEAIERFFANGAVRLAWAEDLHVAFSDFFSNYRILCEVHYMMNDRTNEMQMRAARRKSGKIGTST